LRVVLTIRGCPKSGERRTPIGTIRHTSTDVGRQSAQLYGYYRYSPVRQRGCAGKPVTIVSHVMGAHCRRSSIVRAYFLKRTGLGDGPPLLIMGHRIPPGGAHDRSRRLQPPVGSFYHPPPGERARRSFALWAEATEEHNNPGTEVPWQ